MKKFFFSYVFAVLLISSCTNVKQVAQNGTEPVSVDESAVLWQQTSAEYEALCLQAYNSAKSYLESFDDEKLSSLVNPIVVFDIDETILNNSPYNGYLIQNNEKYSKETWLEWVNKKEAELVPGVKEFIDYLELRGLEMFFISNRGGDELSATLENLTAKGIFVDPSKVLLKTGESLKEGRRSQVKDDNYNIIMLIGDNLADFDKIFEETVSISERKIAVERMKVNFGKRFIVLPNVMYGDWRKALNSADNASIQDASKTGYKKLIKSF